MCARAFELMIAKPPHSTHRRSFFARDAVIAGALSGTDPKVLVVLKGPGRPTNRPSAQHFFSKRYPAMVPFSNPANPLQSSASENKNFA